MEYRPPVSAIVWKPDLHVASRSSDLADCARALFDAAPDWLRSTLQWLVRFVTQAGEFVAGVIRTVKQFGTTTPPAREGLTMESDLTPPDRLGWRFRSGVIQEYVAPAAIRQLERVAVTLSSGSAPVDVAEARAAVETATHLLPRIDHADTSTALRTLAAVETIGTSGLDPLGCAYDAAATAWERGGWPATHLKGAQTMLDLSVREMCTALSEDNQPRARMYAALVGAVASVRHRDAVERLLWFADGVATPVHRAGIDAAAVRTSLTRCVGRWFARVRGAPVCSVVDVMHAYWREEIPTCLHRDAVEQWVSGALREVRLRRDRESSAVRPRKEREPVPPH